MTWKNISVRTISYFNRMDAVFVEIGPVFDGLRDKYFCVLVNVSFDTQQNNNKRIYIGHNAMLHFFLYS